jgi:hypothetical protein
MYLRPELKIDAVKGQYNNMLGFQPADLFVFRPNALRWADIYCPFRTQKLNLSSY